MTTFALVHGAWHGAWCWERLVPELESAGHRTVAMDLPCDDPSATFETYADVVVRALDDVGDDVVLVAHSMGGHTIPLVAARRPVRALVYLCALLPLPGISFAEQAAGEADMLVPRYEEGLSPLDDRGRRHWVDEDRARETFFADCEPQVAAEALRRLRPQASTPYGQRFPLESLDLGPTTYVVCAQDRIVNPDWSRRVASQRLGVAPVELSGSHSPFLSRPADLARILLAAA